MLQIARWRKFRNLFKNFPSNFYLKIHQNITGNCGFVNLWILPNFPEFDVRNLHHLEEIFMKRGFCLEIF